MKKILRLFTKRFFLLLNIIVAILLICTKLIPIINPSKYWLMGILGLCTPFIAAANILFIVFWVFFKKGQYLLLSLFAIIISWNIFSVGFAGNYFSKTNIIQSTDVKIMTYNVRLFDLYNWTGKKNTRANMMNFIKEKNPDILCLQEIYTSEDSTGIQNVKEICKNCNYPYTAINKNYETKRGYFGDIIFSRYPIVREESFHLDTCIITHKFQYADITLPTNETIRVFNLHLQSIRFDKQDYTLLDNKEENENLEKSKIIVQKLKIGFDKRGSQANIVKKEMDACNYPVIVCGDFNDIPSSYTYFTVRGKLNDAFLDKGAGLGRTYFGISPILRIDNVFYSANQIEVHSFQKFHVNYSDHFPLMVSFEMKKVTSTKINF